jgi:hypothetical protein
MATRSRIAIENQDGSVTSVYCHWDGHIYTNGVILNYHYNTKEKVEELIGLGYLSSLGITIEETDAFHRDRGEEFIQIKYSNVEELFENGFEIPGTGTYHMELAFVEVSTDGKKFHRFPAQSLNDSINQIDNFTGLYPEKVRSLAGKYIAGFGVPFDLEELLDSLQNQTIHYIRIVDVVGSLNDSFVSKDVFGRKINDPFPTPYPSSGFDLDAIGIIHGKSTNAINELSSLSFNLYPNPFNSSATLSYSLNTKENVEVAIFDIAGKQIAELSNGMQSEGKHELQINKSDLNLNSGIYFIKMIVGENTLTQKVVLN